MGISSEFLSNSTQACYAKFKQNIESSQSDDEITAQRDSAHIRWIEIFYQRLKYPVLKLKKEQKTDTFTFSVSFLFTLYRRIIVKSKTSMFIVVDVRVPLFGCLIIRYL